MLVQTQGLGAPIDRLSDDLLCEIFQQCLPSKRQHITVCPTKAPTLLTHVCQRWRCVVIDYAILWAWLKLNIRWDHLRNDSDWYDTFKTVALRSRSAPRRLQLKLVGSSQDETPSSLEDAAMLNRLVAPVAGTLTRLTLGAVPIDALRHLPPGLFPVLERLALTTGEDSSIDNDSTPRPVTAFLDAPSLRRVALRTWYLTAEMEGSLYTILFPFQQLTHLLEFDGGTAAEPWFFKACSHLEYLSVDLSSLQVGAHIASTQGSLEDNKQMLRLETLKGLNIAFWQESRDPYMAYPGFFDFVEFPNLESLLLDGLELDFTIVSHFTPEQTVRFLAKIKQLKLLRYISLSCNDLDRGSLKQLLEATTYITTLDAHIYGNFQHLFPVLNNSTPEYADVLPLLDTLVLEVGLSDYTQDKEGITVDPDDFLVNFVKPRIMQCDPQRRRLRKIIVYGTREEDIADGVPFLEILRPCVEEGLVVLERHLCKPQGANRWDRLWLDRVPELQDWPELSGW